MKLNNINIKENIYGHKKKLIYILTEIDRFIKKNDLAEIKILDLGCGNGNAVTYYIAQNFPQAQITGIDIHQDSIVFARENFKLPNLNFICQDIFAENINSQYDIIILSDILEHFANPEKLLNLINNQLTNQGVAIVAIPNGYGPYELERKFCKYTGIEYILNKIFYLKSKLLSKKQNIPYNSESGHLYFFTWQDFNSKADKYNLKVINFRKGTFIGSTLSGLMFGRVSFLNELNSKISDYLPKYFCGSWYFTLKKYK